MIRWYGCKSNPVRAVKRNQSFQADGGAELKPIQSLHLMRSTIIITNPVEATCPLYTLDNHHLSLKGWMQ
jgi:hypothetical protein